MKSRLIKGFRFSAGLAIIVLDFYLVLSFFIEMARIHWLSGKPLIFLLGFVFFALMHFILGQPAFFYVLAHEASHSLATLLFGGRVKAIYVSETGGSVKTDRSNVIISLFPYFFPFYAVLLLTVYSMASLIGDIKGLNPYFYFLMGAAVSHHICFTLKFLFTKQRDFQESGHFFSFAVIVGLNLMIAMSFAALFFEDASFVRFFNRGIYWLANIF